MKNSTFNKLDKFIEHCIKRRSLIASLYVLVTAVMFYFALQVPITTLFEDLHPRTHEYVKTHEEYKDLFGGSNIVTIMLRTDEESIFQEDVLSKIKKVSSDLALVSGVNSTQITSIASPRLKDVKASSYSIESEPFMFPDVPDTEKGIAELRETIISNPLVYGSYVSRDLKSALITVDFYERELDYKEAFAQINELVESVEGDGVSGHVVGDPMLYGWVNHYLPETFKIFGVTILGLFLLLLGIMRTWRGTILPLFAGLAAATWALGAARLLGINFDPLGIVIAFLIMARAVSHSVQIVSRFEDEVATSDVTSDVAARVSMENLFKPGVLGLVSDIGCIAVVALTPIPLMQKIAFISFLWASSIIVTALIMTPVLLSWLTPKPAYVHPVNVFGFLEKLLNGCFKVATTRWRYFVLSCAAVVFLVSSVLAFDLTIGNAEPGSPILWQDSEYNQDSEKINDQFQGADSFYVVFEGDDEDALKRPEVLNSFNELQRYMVALPGVVGSVSVSDVLVGVNRVLREGNPRYQEIGPEQNYNAELFLMWAPDSGEASNYMDGDFRNAAIRFYLRDRNGDTIRSVFASLKQFIDENPVEGGEYRLAGGGVAVAAAVNEIILSDQMKSIGLALVWLLICCGVAYRTLRSGLLFMVPVILSNTITFSYMAWQDIGLTLSTLPIAALGIGLGVDYTVYVVDGIREQLHLRRTLKDAIQRSLRSAGKGVLITAITLLASVGVWGFSSLRFQAEMGMLMGLWIFVSAFTALFVIPSVVYVFKPDFLVNIDFEDEDKDEDEGEPESKQESDGVMKPVLQNQEFSSCQKRSEEAANW